MFGLFATLRMFGANSNGSASSWHPMAHQIVIADRAARSGKYPGVTVEFGEESVSCAAFCGKDVADRDVVIKKTFSGGTIYVLLTGGKTLKYTVKFDCGLQTQTDGVFWKLEWKRGSDASWTEPPINATLRDWPQMFAAKNADGDWIKEEECFEECERKWMLSLQMHMIRVLWKASPVDRKRFMMEGPSFMREWLKSQQIMRIIYDDQNYVEYTFDMNISSDPKKEGKEPVFESVAWGTSAEAGTSAGGGVEIGRTSIDTNKWSHRSVSKQCLWFAYTHGVAFPISMLPLLKP